MKKLYRVKSKMRPSAFLAAAALLASAFFGAAFPVGNARAEESATHLYKIQGYDNESGAPIIAGINVYDFGAEGDGAADDTDAFERAFQYVVTSPSGGGIVYVPAGKYLLTRPIVVPEGVCLRGQWNDPTGKNKKPESVLLCKPAESQAHIPMLRLSEKAAVKGMSFYYPDQKIGNVAEYGATVSVLGHGVGIEDLTLYNSYIGIVTGISLSAGSEVTVSRVYGTALKQAVLIDWDLNGSQIT
ncbi:MAG: glycoside hydrolase family 55 protein, partial [Clostridiales bacterium]|nr:glycoside hydrolase family 55 protein [Clostridiales bacterium]